MQILHTYLYEMCQNFCSLLGLFTAEYLLDRPKAGVIETFCERYNIWRHHMFVLFGPSTTCQLIWLYGSKDRKIQQRYLSGQLIGGHTQSAHNDGI